MPPLPSPSLAPTTSLPTTVPSPLPTKTCDDSSYGHYHITLDGLNEDPTDKGDARCVIAKATNDEVVYDVSYPSNRERMEDDACLKNGCYALTMTRGIATVHDSAGNRFHVRSDLATSATFCALSLEGTDSTLYEQPSSAPTTYRPTTRPTYSVAPSTAAPSLRPTTRCAKDEWGYHLTLAADDVAYTDEVVFALVSTGDSNSRTLVDAKFDVDGVAHSFFCAMDGCYTLLLAATEGTAVRITDHDAEVMTCRGTTCEDHVCLTEGDLATKPSAPPTSPAAPSSAPTYFAVESSVEALVPEPRRPRSGHGR